MAVKPLHCVYGKFIIPQRVVLAIVLHLAMLNVYNLRVVINVAITEMVEKPPPSNRSRIVDDCPNLLPEKDPPIKDGQYKWDSNDQALIKYIFFVGYFIGHFPGGWLSDKIGARHVTGTCILLAAILNLVQPILITSGGEYWGFVYSIIIRFLIGLVQGPIVPTIATFMSNWAPTKERAYLGGIAYAGGNLGNIVGIIVTGVIIYYTRSWANAFYLWGFLAILWYILFLFTVFSYPETHPFITDEEKTFLAEIIAKKPTKFHVPWKEIATCCPIWAIFAAQFGHNYVLFAMNTDLPKFVKEFLKMNIKNNGIVTAMPFVFCWISAIGSGFIADFIINKKLMSILNMRKLYTIISILGPAICNVIAVYVGCSRWLVVFLCTFGMFWMGPFWSSTKVNVSDLSKHYGGILMAIINGFGAWAGILAPFITGYFTPDGTLRQWRLVFWIMMFIAVITSVIYLFFAKAERQNWDYWEGEAPPTTDA
ncbi:sialin-like [Rhynchophorus ferrugineus]|uniref:sialin-like n=1 Tax=Rhynchophorus ferrugineus TaxID=354439 RepID=UPI003FCD52A9